MALFTFRVLARHLTMNGSLCVCSARPVSEVHRVESSDIRRSEKNRASPMKYEDKKQENRKASGGRVWKAPNAGEGGMAWPFTANFEARPSHTLSLTPFFFLASNLSRCTRVSAMFFSGVLPLGHSAFAPLLLLAQAPRRNTASKQQENRSQKKGQAGCRCEKLEAENKPNAFGHLPLPKRPRGRGTREWRNHPVQYVPGRAEDSTVERTRM